MKVSEPPLISIQPTSSKTGFRIFARETPVGYFTSTTKRFVLHQTMKHKFVHPLPKSLEDLIDVITKSFGGYFVDNKCIVLDYSGEGLGWVSRKDGKFLNITRDKYKIDIGNFQFNGALPEKEECVESIWDATVFYKEDDAAKYGEPVKRNEFPIWREMPESNFWFENLLPNSDVEVRGNKNQYYVFTDKSGKEYVVNFSGQFLLDQQRIINSMVKRTLIRKRAV